jgi:hypothetical protein
MNAAAISHGEGKEDFIRLRTVGETDLDAVEMALDIGGVDMVEWRPRRRSC